MKFTTRLLPCLTILSCLYCTTVFSQPGGFADTTKLDKPISVLNDKLSFSFPTGAINSPRVADIMAANPNMNRETRVIIDDGGKRLVFFAQELYAFGGNKLFDEISKEVEPEFDFQRKILSDSDSVLAILSTPTRFDSTATAILVSSLLVRSPDNTVSRVDVYINPDAWALKEEYIRLTQTVFKTMVKGKRADQPECKRRELYNIRNEQQIRLQATQKLLCNGRREI